MNIRELVYKSLILTEKEKKFSNIELNNKVNSYSLTGVDKALFTSLYYGVIERTVTLDYFIGIYSSKPFSRLDLPVIVLLRMGIYQIIYMDKIPDSAAVNETVRLSSRYASRAKGYINGILRKISDNKEHLEYPDKKENEIRWLSVFYSVPEWICRLWKKDYPDHAEKMIAELSVKRQITFRVNTLKTTRDKLLDSYNCLTPCRFSPFGVRLNSALPLSEFSPLTDGSCFVQDEASQLAAIICDPREKQIIVDVCCAPGGKTFSAAMLSGDNAEIVSCDLHENKLSLVRKEAEILGVKSVKVFAHDASIPIADFIGKADRVICDVPCSGLGVISRKSDLRYKPEESIVGIDDTQYAILTASSAYLKKGGILVYSTCTLRKAENEDVVQKFVDSNPDFSLLPFSFGKISSNSGMLTFFPDIYHTDGFFVAKITRNN